MPEEPQLQNIRTKLASKASRENDSPRFYPQLKHAVN
jgi:hypothetical protein